MSINPKTRAIYDALDNMQYKTAVNLCNKYLKKAPVPGGLEQSATPAAQASILVTALKALALEKMDTEATSKEAHDIATEIAKNPSILGNDAIMQALSHTFRSQAQNHHIAKMYEDAVAKRTKDEEAYNHLFMAYVRASDFKQQQQLATKMHKLFGARSKEPDRYLYWSIMSLYLQGTKGAAAGSGFELVLAERMLTKCLAENRIGSMEEFRLYMMTLEAQGKFKESLELLDGEWGKKMKMLVSDMLKMKSGYYKKLGMFKEIREASKAISSIDDETVDDWDSWSNWVIAIFESTDDEKNRAENVRDIRDFLNGILNKEPRTLKRGPYLALIELEKHLGSFDQMRVQIIKYFEIFGDKLCCFDDLSPYLDSFTSNDERSKLAAQLLEMIPARTIISTDEKEEKKITAAKKWFLRDITLYKIKARLGLLDTAKPDDTIADLLKKYQESLVIKREAETERQLGDDYVHLAAQVLLLNSSKNGGCFGRDVCAKIIVLLEYALSKSAYNFQFKLLLIRCYLRLGVFERVQELYKTLDVKHILHDTMGHFFPIYTRVSGITHTSSLLLEKTNSISLSNKRETPEMICRAFQYSTFSQIPEFIEFQNRLKNSLTQCHVALERSRLKFQQVLVTPHGEPARNTADLRKDVVAVVREYQMSFVFGQLSDNREMNIMSNWFSKSELDIEKFTRPRGTFTEPEIEVQCSVMELAKSLVTDEGNFDAAHRTIEKFIAHDSCDDIEKLKLSAIVDFAHLCKSQTSGPFPRLEDIKSMVKKCLSSVDSVDLTTFYTLASVFEVCFISMAVASSNATLQPIVKELNGLCSSITCQIDSLITKIASDSLEVDLSSMSFESADEIKKFGAEYRGNCVDSWTESLKSYKNHFVTTSKLL